MQDVQKTDGVKEITNPSSIIDIKSSLLQQIRDKVCSALLIEKKLQICYSSRAYTVATSLCKAYIKGNDLRDLTNVLVKYIDVTDKLVQKERKM